MPKSFVLTGLVVSALVAFLGMSRAGLIARFLGVLITITVTILVVVILSIVLLVSLAVAVFAWSFIVRTTGASSYVAAALLLPVVLFVFYSVYLNSKGVHAVFG